MPGKFVRSLAAAALLAAGSAAQTTVLSDNLAAFAFTSEMASTSIWLCAGFGTDAKTYALTTVELRLSDPSGSGFDAAEVAIYTSAGAGVGQPGVPVGTLSSPVASGPLVSFTASGITLAPSSTYWVVLRSTTAGKNYFWRWTPEDTGTGVGFLHTWGFSDDSGAHWTTYDTAPLMMRVTAEALPWSNLGFALPGAGGSPGLAGDGPLVAGTPGTLTLSHAAPAAAALLCVSLSSSPAPFKGGVLVPAPVSASFPALTSPAGDVPLGWSAWPPGLSGLELYFQYAIQDAGAVKGVALSNAVRADVP